MTLTIDHRWQATRGHYWRARCPRIGCPWLRDYTVEANAADAIRAHEHLAHDRAMTPRRYVARKHHA